MNITSLGEARFASPIQHPVSEKERIPADIVRDPEFFANLSTEQDQSGNLKLKDIGLFLRERIETYFKDADVPVVMRYFDPSYLIRSSPANAADSVLCDLYARNAVHAAMAGKTGLVIGFLHDSFIHIPIEMLVREKKHIDTDGVRWKAVLAATGQPARFE
jgi:6-phosphofructokinase 1